MITKEYIEPLECLLSWSSVPPSVVLSLSPALSDLGNAVKPAQSAGRGVRSGLRVPDLGPEAGDVVGGVQTGLSAGLSAPQQGGVLARSPSVGSGPQTFLEESLLRLV